MAKSTDAHVRVHPAIDGIDARTWDRLANPPELPHNPFIAHGFLKALEEAGCVSRRTGWLPRHLALEEGGAVTGVMPCYVKSHSKGEYIFDYGWAEAYERAGGRYYPKLQVAVPFTPVPGRRLLVAPGAEAERREQLLLAGGAELAQRIGASSLHVTFLTEAEWRRAGTFGLLQRTDQQFHWTNEGYATFDDFLAALASRKRKTVRKEREQALAAGITIEHVTGSAISEAHWDVFYDFYMDTGSRKWGRPYLNRDFFSLLGRAMADRCLLVLAKRNGRHIAGALNMIGGDTLYGRYWGAIEQHPCLHFEVCYYQAIEYAITHKLQRVEAGAQGEHKLARGYMPTPVYSAHWIADTGFRKAVARYLADERAYMEEHRAELATYAPYRQAPAEHD